MELEHGRAVPTPDEAGRIRARVGILRGRGRSRMGARLAIASLLAGGVIMSGGGAALALSGESSHGNVAAAGYSGATVSPQVLGETQGSTPNVSPQVLGETQGTSPSAATGTQVQAAQQVASSGTKSLPFTGFAAIPIVLAGIAMLGGGAWLRRRMRTA